MVIFAIFAYTKSDESSNDISAYLKLHCVSKI